MTPKNEKLEEQKDSTPEKADQSPQEAGADSTWEQDQKSRDYYYDDTYGYETYNPEDDEDE